MNLTHESDRTAGSTVGAVVPVVRLASARHIWRDSASFRRLFSAALEVCIERTIAPRQTALIRMGISLTFGFFLLREWSHRRVLFGDLSPFSMSMEKAWLSQSHAFTLLAWSSSRWWFEGIYLAAILVSALLLLGWHTRTMSVLFMVLVLSIQNRNVFVGDGGDNLVHLMAIYLAFTKSGQAWSLDSQRNRRTGNRPSGNGRPDLAGISLWAILGSAMAVCQISGFAKMGMLNFGFGWGTVLWGFWVLTAVGFVLENRSGKGQFRWLLESSSRAVHNAAVVVIGVQVCFIYAVAGSSKVQGGLWQEGTAVFYPLRLDYFSPWPWLSNYVSGSMIAVVALTYGTILMQTAFPFAIFNRRVKNCLLVLLLLEHLGIGILLGLPFFSLAIISSDAIFLPTNLLVRIEQRILRQVRVRKERLGRDGRPADAGSPETPPRMTGSIVLNE